LQQGAFVEIHYPQTYRDTGTITHLPSAIIFDQPKTSATLFVAAAG